MTTPKGKELTFAVKLDFQTTDNEAEYKAVLAGLNLALKLGAKDVEIKTDSQVIAHQIQGYYEARGKKMKEC